jgi:hypothetical protein
MSLDRLTLTWQPVEAEEAEEERRSEQTEREEMVLAALKQITRARAADIAKLIGKDPSNIHKCLMGLWKAGKCKRDLVDNKPYYFIEDHNENFQEDEIQNHDNHNDHATIQP